MSETIKACEVSETVEVSEVSDASWGEQGN